MGVRSKIASWINQSLKPMGLTVQRVSTVGGERRAFSALLACGLTVDRCIDVGAHTGGWTESLLEVWPKASVLLVEPQEKLLEDARRRLSRRRHSVHFLAVGAGPVDEEREFFHHERLDSSSFGMSLDFPRVVSSNVLPVRRLDTMISAIFGSATPDIVKLDCEGWDLEVFRGLGAYTGTTPVLFIEAGVQNPDFRNDVASCLDVLSKSGYRLFNVEYAAHHARGMWNAELCFVAEGSKIWSNAQQWTGD